MKRRVFMGLLCLLLGLTACGRDDTEDGRVVYVPQEVEFDSGLGTIDGCCLIGETLYLSGHTTKSKSGPCRVVRLSLAGGEAEELPDFQPLKLSGGPFYLGATLQAGAEGTLWITENAYNIQSDQELPGRIIAEAAEDAPRFEDALILRHLDAGGRELACFSARRSGLEARLDL